MLSFQYQNPTLIVFGKGEIPNLAQLIPVEAKILLTYGGGSIKTNGVYNQVVKALKGHRFSEFGGIESNPDFDTLMRAVAQVKLEKIDFLLAVGGGSVLDGTKFIAAAARFAGDPWEILIGQQPITDALPFGAVLTLPATGSEMNGGAVISRRATGDKLSFSNPLLFPRFSVLDPQTTLTLSPRQTANGVVDAFVHTIEQYLTYPVNSPLQDRLSESLLLTLIEEGPKVLANPNDYDARANIMWCATLALNGLIGCGVPQDWTSHMIGHEITALHGLDHAQTLAVVLPAVMQVRRDAKREKLLQYARRVWGVNSCHEEQVIDRAIAKTREFFESLGVKTRFGDYEIGQDAIPALVDNLIKHQMTGLGERMDITAEVSRKILETAL